VLLRNAAAVGELASVEVAQLLAAAVQVIGTGRLARVAVGLEGLDDGVEIAGGERAGTHRRDRGGAARNREEQRRPVRVAAGVGPAAEVDPELFDPLLGVVLDDQSVWELDPPRVGVESDEHLFEAPRLGDDDVGFAGRGVMRGEPPAHVGDEIFERPDSDDFTPDRVAEPRLAGKRLDQGIKLAAENAVEVGHDQAFLSPPRRQSLDRRRREELGGPRHLPTVSHS
jgi:hypothetical protein